MSGSWRSTPAASPLALVMPCLVTELDQPALAGMVSSWPRTPYLDTVVISLDRADAAGFERALDYFRALGGAPWSCGTTPTRSRASVREIERDGLGLGPRPARGARCGWPSATSSPRSARRRVAFHDADVVDYERSLLANLVYPILHPSLGVRLLQGVLRALHGPPARPGHPPAGAAAAPGARRRRGRHPYLSYLAPSATRSPARSRSTPTCCGWLRIPGDWGLEVGLLFEVLRHRSARRICQVDVADRFEHKHQPLCPPSTSPGPAPHGGGHRQAPAANSRRGRRRAAVRGGVQGPARRLPALRRGRRVRLVRGRDVQRPDASTVTPRRRRWTFSRALAEGCQQFHEDPLGTPPLPNWARVLSAFPEVGDRLVGAVPKLGGVIEP